MLINAIGVESDDGVVDIESRRRDEGADAVSRVTVTALVSDMLGAFFTPPPADARRERGDAVVTSLGGGESARGTRVARHEDAA